MTNLPKRLLIVWLACLMGALLWLSPNPHPPVRHSVNADVSALLWEESRQQLWLGSRDGFLEVRPMDEPGTSQRWPVGQRRVVQIALSAAGDLLSAVIEGEQIQVWNVDRRELVRQWDFGTISRGAISPAGNWVASGNEQGEVWLNAVQGGPGQKISQHGKRVTALSWSPSGRYLMSGSQDGSILVWDQQQQSCLLAAAEPHSTILGLSIPADNEQFLRVIHFDQTLTEFDLQTGQRVRQRVGQTHTQGAAFDSTGSWLVTVGRNGRVTVQNPFGEPHIFRYLGPAEGAIAVLARSDTPLPVVGTGGARTFSTWRLESWQHPLPGWALPIWLGLGVSLVCWVTWSDWRWGLLMCLALDVLRDPVRKLTMDSPVWITLMILPAWGGVMLAAWRETPRTMGLRWSGWKRAGVGLMLVWILIKSVQTCFLTTAAPQLLFLGFTAYLSPLAGVWLGCRFLQRPEDLRKYAVWLCVVNLVMVGSVGLECFSWDWRGLGGIQFDWIRYRSRGLISLMSGWYRSPNLLGFHAVLMAVFAVLLATYVRRWRRWIWLLVSGCGVLGALLAGRRKMLLILVVVGLTLAATIWTRLVQFRRRTQWAIGLCAITLLAGGVGLAVFDQATLAPYLKYAASLGSEGLGRVQSLTASVRETFRQSGPWGVGLGVATQGSYRWRGAAPRMWQEDGVSRIAAELGWPGLVMLGVCGVWLMKTVRRALRIVRIEDRLRGTLLAGLVLGEFCSYLSDHQTFSGDPSSTLLAALPLGFLLALSLRPEDN